MQGAAAGLEGCHATCDGREQRRKLINCSWIINSWSPEAQSLRLDFFDVHPSAGVSGGSSLGQGFHLGRKVVQATLLGHRNLVNTGQNNKGYYLLKVSSAQVGKPRLKEVN